MQECSCCIVRLTLHTLSSNDSFADAFRRARQEFRKVAMLLLYTLQKILPQRKSHILFKGPLQRIISES